MFKTLTILLFLSAVANGQISRFSEGRARDLDNQEVDFKKFEKRCLLVINTVGLFSHFKSHPF